MIKSRQKEATGSRPISARSQPVRDAAYAVTLESEGSVREMAISKHRSRRPLSETADRETGGVVTCCECDCGTNPLSCSVRLLRAVAHRVTISSLTLGGLGDNQMLGFRLAPRLERLPPSRDAGSKVEGA